VVSQANGAGEFHLARVYLHRQYVITGISCVVMFFPLLYMREILLAIGQDPVIVNIAVKYINWCIPGVFFNAISV
jgi:Na+-driven multidrug efflux pump